MRPASKFDITRADDGARHASNVYDSAAPRGLGLGVHPFDETKFFAATHNNFIGFLKRDVVVGGLTLADRVFGRTSASPVGPEGPFTAGEEVTVEKAHEIEAEGYDYLWLSGTGSIDTNTALPQAMSMHYGRWRKTQSGENVNGYLTANNLTLHDADAGVLRVRIEVLG